MPVVSHLSSIVLLGTVLIISLQCGLIDGEKHRHRRQQQQQPTEPAAPAAQKGSSSLLASSIQNRGYYQSSEFKPPSLSGEKPVSWFDTKYPNWISNHQTNDEKSGGIDGKNAAPSNLQAAGGVPPPRRDDAGVPFMQKIARQYANKGQKSYNYLQSTNQIGRASVCSNFDNYHGFIFGKFPCPLPIATGMNQLDRFCCGPVNSQYCCNEQEFHYQSRPSYGAGQVNARHGQYYPSKNRAVAIVVPIVGTLVVVGALIIVFLYYKKLRSEQQKSSKPSVAPRTHENYSAVPQEVKSEDPNI